MKKTNKYDHTKIEKKWQNNWKKSGIYTTKEVKGKPKCYVLDMFPYPSGVGLHVGHPKGYIATDVYARFKTMSGFNVLHPMGWDAFGLPAEEYAIKNKIHPSVAVKKNIETYKKQLSLIGLNYDWKREVNTTDPAYYKWTQWAFLQMYKKGLAFESYEPINWCPSCKTGLANEDLENGRCERCGSVVEKRPLRQWVLKITKYADRLLKDLDGLNWPESIKTSQRNWIGRSEGVNFKCNIKDLNIEVEMYNSVPQTYRAETFTVIAPDHKLVPELVKGTEHEKKVLEFVEKIKQKKLANKFDVDKDMEGVFTGRYIENFAGTGRDLPIWVASYVVSDYGTGMVNCSAHDERDYAFALKYNISLHPVAEPLFVSSREDDAYKPGAPEVERRAAVCVVKHWSEDKYLCLSWKSVDWKGFVIGGIEGEENAAEAGMREIIEETGYQNPEFVKELGGTIHSKFYQSLKKQNRFAHFTPLLFKLKNDARTEISAEEDAIHTLHWLTPEEVAKFINRDDMKLVWERSQGVERPVIKNGILTEPTEFAGREWSEVREDIIDYLVKKGFATRKVNYKLRDWVFSRQRYWGEPIPLIHCEKCGVVPVPEKDLPVKLPNVKSYEPTGTGESPLAGIEKWVNVKCPQCRGKAKRETNTMPQWAGSCWYYLRYIDPKNKKALVDPKKEKYWMPVDMYVGGAEHATRHLIYARFWHKFLYDIGAVSTIEPFMQLKNQGLIAGPDGRKMSKRYGNVINPDDVIKTFGADTLRVYEMFMGPFEQGIAWSTDNMIGSRRFLEKVWRLQEKVVTDKKKIKDIKLGDETESLLHKSIKKVGEDIAAFTPNTAISTLMILTNALEKEPQIDKETYETVLKLVAPFAPHITDEIWATLGNKKSIHLANWPVFDPKKLQSSTFKIVIQINGKVRATFESDTDDEEKVKEMALLRPEIVSRIGSAKPHKVIYVKGKLVNIVIPGL